MAKLALPYALLACLLAAVPLAAAQGRAVTTSTLASVKFDLPAVLVTDKDAVQDLLAALDDAAGGLASRCAESEVVVWQGSGYVRAKGGAIITNTSGRLTKTGYAYKASKKEMDGTTAITFFTALSPTKSLAGVWVSDDASLVLAWCRLVPAPAAKPPGTNGHTQ